MFHSAQSSLIDFVWDFRSKGSRPESVVNSVNLFRVSIASSTLFCDGGDMGSSGTSSSSLLPSSTVSIGCGRFSLQFRQQAMVEIRWRLSLYQNQRAHQHHRFSGAKSALPSQSRFRSHSNLSTALSSSPSSTIPLNGSSWSSIAPSGAFNEIPDFQKQFWIVSHFTLSFLQHHRGFKNWCSGQLFMHVYRSGDLANNQGLVFSLHWPEIEKIEKTYKTITFGITRCFLKTLPGEEWT